MNSHDAFDDGPAHEDESWSSSDGDNQVVQTLTRSWNLISPQKGRGSAHDNNALTNGKKRASLKKRDMARLKPRLKANYPNFQANKSCWTQKSCEVLANNQTVNSDNSSGVSEDGNDRELELYHDNCSDSDASIKADVETDEPQKKLKLHKHHVLPPPFTRSMQSLDSIPNPGDGLKDLKATLETLAQHDKFDDDMLIQKEPIVSSAITLHQYLAAATATKTEATANGICPTGMTQMKTRQASVSMPQLNLYSFNERMKATSETARQKDIRLNVKRDHRPGKVAKVFDGCQTFGNERPSFNKKIFCSPPSPFRGRRTNTRFASPLQDTCSVRGCSIRESGVQGSRALLLALKALQDKIGQLEEERESLMQQLFNTKQIARERKTELVTIENKLSNELAQAKESVSAAYDALQNDCRELKDKLNRSEERREESQRTLQYFQELAPNLSAKADDLQSKLNIFESTASRLETELEETKSCYNGTVDKLQAEVARLEQNRQAKVEQIKLLETQLQREAAAHAESRNQLSNAEQKLASVLQENEALMAKMVEASQAVIQETKKNKKLQQQTRSSTLSRPKAASHASAAIANETATRRAAKSAAVHENTKVTSTKTLKKKKKPSETISLTLPKPESYNKMTLLRESNLNKKPSYLLGNSVQPSISLHENAQDTSWQCDSTCVVPTPHCEMSKPTILAKQAFVPAVPEAHVSLKQSRMLEDLCAVVNNAEKEYERLNEWYNDIAMQLKARRCRDATKSSSERLSQALGPMLDELKAKAVQLNLLKDIYQQAASTTINSQRYFVLSSSASESKTAPSILTAQK